MGAAAAPVAFGLSLANIGFQASAEKLKAKGNAEAAAFQAARKERAAEIGKIQADQTDASMREELNTTLANIDAIRSAGNADPLSPTSMAVKAEEERISDRDRRNKVFNLKAQADEDELSARYLRRTSSDALLAGRLAVGATITKGLAGAIPR